MRRFMRLLGAGFGLKGRGVSGQHEDGKAEEKRSDEAECTGLAVEHPEAESAGKDGGTVKECVGKGGEADVGFGDIVQGGSSLAASSFALVGLSSSALVYPEVNGPAMVLAGVGAWVALAVSTYAVDRGGYRKGIAQLSPDSAGGGRVALTFVVFGLCLLRIDGLEGLAGVVGVAALALGGMSDGAWIAALAERRALGFFGALRQQFVWSKDSRKWLFRSRFEEDRR